MLSSTVRPSRKSIGVNLALVAILLVSLWLRLDGIDWDGLYHLHPDERYIVWVGTTIEWPADWRTAFDPTQSPFNPFYWPPEARSSGIMVQRGEPRAFAYGHWPLYLGVAASHLLAHGSDWAANLPAGWSLPRALLNANGRIEYHHLLLVGRAVAALMDTLTVWLVFLLGRRLYGPVGGLLAAGLLAVSVLHIQSAHFFITDPFLTTAVVATVYWMVRRAELAGPTGRRAQWWATLAAGGLLGMAVGAKFSAIMLGLPLGVALIWRRQVPPVARGSRWTRYLARGWRWIRQPAFELAVALLVACLVFLATNPFALLDNTCEDSLGGWMVPVVNWKIGPFPVHSCYLKNIGTQGAMVRGGTRIPFTFQYIGTRPYVYYLAQMARWGLGLPLTLLGFGGLLWGAARLLRGWRRPGGVVLLAWAIPFFAVTGSFQVKFLRYLLPLIPFLAILGAGMLVEFGRRASPRAGLRQTGAVVAAVVTLVFTGAWAVMFSGLYRVAEHPWVSASRWIYENVTAGSTLAVEHWDHALPLALNSQDWPRVQPRYNQEELEWFYVGDRLRKPEEWVPLDQVLQQVSESDYLVFASNRLYGVIPRLPARFPEAAAYYRLLFAEKLGFELVYWSARYPSRGNLAVVDDSLYWPGLDQPATLGEWQPAPLTLSLGPADESFTVYDHPMVLVFENRGRLGTDELKALVLDESGG